MVSGVVLLCLLFRRILCLACLLLEAACGQLHAALVCSAGRDHARHCPLARVLPSLQALSLAALLLTLLPPLLVGQINSLNGVLGYATGQCMLDYMRIVVESISQPEYEDLIPMFSIVNEALARRRNYLQACNMMRGITGYGAGNGPFISIHDGFQGTPWWTGSRPPPPPQLGPYHPPHAPRGPLGGRAEAGVQLAGVVVEYEERVRGAGRGIMQDASTWTDTTKAGPKQFCARVDGHAARLVLLDKEDRPRTGRCRALTPLVVPVWAAERFYAPTRAIPSASTGGAGTETIAPTAVQSFGQWPPATLSNVDLSATLLPTHIATASTAIMTFVTPVAGYTYLDTWKAIGSPVPGVGTETPSR
ncbi:hypothetical protein B0H14DRAFT_3496462 [Mycena olivaceomarginata]|nr:hypothetical protein B0H14DRAFT_3496462 [Mycena olivaceomarginata]